MQTNLKTVAVHGKNGTFYRKKRSPNLQLGIRIAKRRAIGLDADTYATIQALADHDGVTFSECARRLLQRALTDPKLWEGDDV